MTSPLRKFSSQAEPEILEALQALADREGRQLQSVLGEAFREYLARRQHKGTRRQILEALRDSIRERDELYRALAK